MGMVHNAQRPNHRYGCQCKKNAISSFYQNCNCKCSQTQPYNKKM